VTALIDVFAEASLSLGSVELYRTQVEAEAARILSWAIGQVNQKDRRFLNRASLDEAVKRRVSAWVGKAEGEIAPPGWMSESEPTRPGRQDESTLIEEASPPQVEAKREGKKPARRNERYEGIDQALRDFAAARPKNHGEVFRLLDDRKVAIPNREPFKTAGGWLKGFQQNPHAASVWLSQAWGRLGLPAFAPGPKK